MVLPQPNEFGRILPWKESELLSYQIKTFFLSALLVVTVSVGARPVQAQNDIKPRILIVFDTSGSMAWDFDGDDTYGDGSIDNWGGGRSCCPGTGDSRMYAAKEAMVQMLNASGEIEFGLLKFSQAYSSSQVAYSWGSTFRSNQYYGNQVNNQWDMLRYGGMNDFSDETEYLAVGFGDYASSGTDLVYGRSVNTENNRSEVVMWMDHHEYGDGTKEGDGSLFLGPAGDNLEQELRADGSTPLGEALNAAEDYLTLLRDPATGLDDFRSCRPYTIIVLTDGEYNGAISPVDAVTSIYADGIDTWVIGLAFQSTTLDNMAAAGGEHYDPSSYGSAFTAYSEAALTAALFNIVSESLQFEVCDYADNDCDGLIDEGVIGPTCDRLDFWGTQGSNVNFPLVCEDPGETQCDGLDDNCNGLVDEAPPDGTWSANEDSLLGAACAPDSAPPYLKDDPDTIAFPCQAGTWECIPGGEGRLCVNYIGPNPEQCDGIDNDCNGEIDENTLGAGDFTLTNGACGSTVGACVEGVMTCTVDGWQCVGGNQGSTEECNGLDDNCNGEVDEYFPEAGDRCYTGANGGCNSDGTGCKGVCVAGFYTCEGISGVACQGEVTGSADDSVCNGLDDDCDGLVDEDAVTGGICPSGADTWTVGVGSTCNAGTYQCLGAAGIVCVGDGGQEVIKPGVEVCDGLDNDCDGTADENLFGSCGGCLVENYPSPTWNCILGDPGAGECRVGIGQCDANNSTPGNPIYINCTDQGPEAESCNGKDDDCDGAIDEVGDLVINENCYPNGLNGCPNPEVDTDTDCTGVCEYGVTACEDGAIVCNGYVSPLSEGLACDDVDNNCNGQVDEGITNTCGDGLDTAAYPGAAYGQGACRFGVQYCSIGVTTNPTDWGNCQGAQGPTDELCNGVDDDCDGLYEAMDTDDLLANADDSLVGAQCGGCDGLYECIRDTDEALGDIGAFGLACIGDAIGVEVCNGEDENCNDIADDGIEPIECGGCEFGIDTDWQCVVGRPDAGTCELGYNYCINGSMSTECYGDVGPVFETCDGLDNDCDDAVDEDFIDLNVVCQEAQGECPQGIRKCTTLSGDVGLHCCDADTWNTLGICEAPRLPGIEICDGLDNDCDGMVDNELLLEGEFCGSSLGVCEPGTYQCIETGDTDTGAVNGYEIVCVGGGGESEEVCNGLDDDCDGPVDEDIPPGDVCTKAPGWMDDVIMQSQYPEGIGECALGNLQCVGGEFICDVPGPTDEVCDGLDNDCDGEIDEDSQVECPLSGSICMEGRCAEPCDEGEFVCPVGKDCIDQGDGIKICMATVCDITRSDALRCVFNDNYCTENQGFVPPCQCDALSQMCVDKCYGKDCGEGMVCVAADAARCHPIEEGCIVTGCGEDEKCVEIPSCSQDQCHECVPDLCANANCSVGEYCNVEGDCVSSCTQVTCDAGQGCENGECVDDVCAGVFCKPGVVCSPLTGKCDSSLTNPCRGVLCMFYQTCVDGTCEFDDCVNVECPNGEYCELGSCYEYVVQGTSSGSIDSDSSKNEDSDSSGMNDSESSGGGEIQDTSIVPTNYQGLDKVLATGTGGCMCSVAVGTNDSSSGLGWLLVLLGGVCGAIRLGLAKQRKWLRPKGVGIGIILVAMFMLGCSIDPYDFAASDSNGVGQFDTNTNTDTDTNTDVDTDSWIDTTSIGDSSSSSDSNNAFDSDSSTDTQVGCANCAADEICCTNEDDYQFCVNLQNNPSHCGQCNNVCSFSHAAANCESGKCAILACEVYWSDYNQSDADGCEHYCKPTANEEDNDDVCDGIAISADPDADNYTPKDNDCDFEYDEDVDFQNDSKNCGFCGNVCLFNHASASCVNGQCAMEQCDTKWWNRENGASDGCEYYCDGDTDAVEICDFKDNNCNGEIDESDPDDGAKCYPNSASGCSEPFGAGDCVGTCLPGAVACVDGSLQCSGYQLPTLELCDGRDNNCNSLVDEGLTIACGGAPGANRNEGLCHAGLALCVSQQFGVNTPVYDTDTGCVGAVGPGIELCDGFDNDCDGAVDELAAGDANGNNISVNDASRLNLPCGLGACAEYLTGCNNGKIECADYVIPDVDIACNSIDDDCDGIVDEISSYQCGGSIGVVCNDTDSGCDPYAQGICQAGVLSCDDTDEVCAGSVPPNCSDTEHCDLCDNLDNDCDGLVDEDAFYTDTDKSCGSPCNDGELQCTGGTLICVGESTPSVDLCDTAGADEDCEPTTPNGSGEANYLQPCDGDDMGLCEEGYWECGPSGMMCNDVTGDDLEICDGVDNDCDGQVDEALIPISLVDAGCDNCPGTTLVVCAGTAGWVCQYDEAAGVECLDTDCYSHAFVEAAFDCDGIDNDCDGVVDDDFQLSSNAAHCGECYYDCDIELLGEPTAPNVGEYYCSQGDCRVKSCSDDSLYFNLDGVDTNGCECELNPVCSGASDCDKCSGGTIAGEDDDCDGVIDEDASVEVCDGQDNDCDGEIDEGLSNPGYCLALCNSGFMSEAACVGGQWTCDYRCGENELECSGFPAEPSVSIPEAVCNGVDGNCDGLADESFGVGGTCSNDSLGTEGGCLKYGVYRCDDAGTGAVCCDLSKQSTGSVCIVGNEINMVDPLFHAVAEDSIPNGIDDDCDGIVDEEASGAVTSIEVSYQNTLGNTLYFEMFAYEASKGDALAYTAGVVSTAACSQADVLPWTYVNFQEARDACQLLNAVDCATNNSGCWDLCSVQQWEHACMDAGAGATVYPYGATYQPNYCNGLDYGQREIDTSADTDTIGIALRPSDYMSYCEAPWTDTASATSFIMDLSGNVEEWTLTSGVLGTGEVLYDIRGGSYNDLGAGLACDFNFTAADGNSAVYRLANLGFRCCRMKTICATDADCLDNHWCNGSGQCEVADTRAHCGDGLGGWEACADYERCVGSIDGCQFCASNEFCGPTCTACTGGEGCVDNGLGSSACI